MIRTALPIALVVAIEASAPWAAAAQIVRVSVATSGGEANGASRDPHLSRDGRFVVFSSIATNLVPGDTNGANDIFIHDRDADSDGAFDEPGATSTSLVTTRPDATLYVGRASKPILSGNGRFVIFSAFHQPPAGVPLAGLFRWDRLTGATVAVCVSNAGVRADGGCDNPSTTDDGSIVVFRSDAANLTPGPAGWGGGIFSREVDAGRTWRLCAPQPPPVFPQPQVGSAATIRQSFVTSPSVCGDGSTAAFDIQTQEQYLSLPGHVISETGTMYVTGPRSSTGALSIGAGFEPALSHNCKEVLYATGSSDAHIRYFIRRDMQTGYTYVPHTSGPTERLASSLDRALVFESVFERRLDFYDFGEGTASVATVPAEVQDFGGAAFDATGIFLALATTGTLTNAANDTNGAMDIFVVELPRLFDRDQDGLDDRWESFYGLNGAIGNGEDGPDGDADGDGFTNRQELVAGTHPNAKYRAYLAEGAVNTFFDSQYALGRTFPSGILMTFQKSDGTIVRTKVPKVPRRQTIRPVRFDGLAPGELSVMVESDRPFALERTMQWGAAGYGRHTESAGPEPSGNWYIAEGTTVHEFELFYLLQNPGASPAQATVRFLRPSLPPLTKVYDLAPGSRTTIHVNGIPELEDTDVSASIAATMPIFVERAMYANRPGQIFALGQAAAGVNEPSATWFLAEGSTGSFFDTYILIANPSTTPADVTARFLRDDGVTVERTYRIGPESRFTIFVDAIPELASAAFSTTLDAHGTAIVVERSMYWPNGFYEYYGSHGSVGSTRAAKDWLMAEGEEGGQQDAQTYVLVANPWTSSTTIVVELSSEEGGNFSESLTLAPTSRVSLSMRQLFPQFMNERFAIRVRVLRLHDPPIVVERSMFWTIGGVTWAAGTNALATPYPDTY